MASDRKQATEKSGLSTRDQTVNNAASQKSFQSSSQTSADSSPTVKNNPASKGFHFGSLRINQKKHAETEKKAEAKSESPVKNPENKSAGSTAPVKPVSPAADIAGAEANPLLREKIIKSLGGGLPLDKKTKSSMSSHFGVDFSQVKIHTDEEAVEMNRLLHAKAFAFHKHIYFSEGAYQPGSEEGKKLLLHELTHVLQSGMLPVIQKAVLRDSAGKATGFEFSVGTEVSEDFVRLAKQNLTGGRMTDAGLRKLHDQALEKNGTVNDFERMFLAGLLDAANVQILQTTAINATTKLVFPINSITRANLQHLISLDRQQLPEKIAGPLKKTADSLKELKISNAVTQYYAAEKIAGQQILSSPGSFRKQAAALVAFASANGVSQSRIYQAMLAASSDQTAADKIFAGSVFAIAENAGLSLAEDLLAGRIKVDALIPSVFARIGMPSKVLAAYVPRALDTGLKGDTIYLQTNLDINHIGDRSTVVHELTHAEQDKRAPKTGPSRSELTEKLEAEAYRKQARYILTQLDALAPTVQSLKINEVTKGGGLVFLGLLVEGQKDLRRFRTLLGLIFASAPAPFNLTAAQLATALSHSPAQVEAALLSDIRSGYNISSSTTTDFDSFSGESFIDVLLR